MRQLIKKYRLVYVMLLLLPLCIFSISLWNVKAVAQLVQAGFFAITLLMQFLIKPVGRIFFLIAFVTGFFIIGFIIGVWCFSLTGIYDGVGGYIVFSGLCGGIPLGIAAIFYSVFKIKKTGWYEIAFTMILLVIFVLAPKNL